MKKNVNKFIETNRQDPAKINLEQRKTKFIEIYQPLENEQSKDQSERCLDCGNPYCQWKCPVHNYIPSWLKLANEGRIVDAAKLSHSTNTFPEICGRVCPQDRLCEGSCTLENGFGAVTIGNIEKYITDEAFKLGWKPDYPEKKSDKKVAIIGAGPAGLACADRLLQAGINVVVYDRNNFIGGLLTFGIPAFKLEKEIIKNRYQLLLEAGAEFKLGTEIGKDIELTQIVDSYDAVFIATGTYQSLSEPAISNHGVFHTEAIDYLEQVNLDLIENKEIRLKSSIEGKKIVVLGGGDTTMDCIRTSIRLGASKVTGVYRRNVKSMPGSKREYQNACEEGSEFIFNAQPVGLVIKDEKLHAVKFVKTEQVTNSDGKTSLEHIAGSEFEIEADVVITAFGFKPEQYEWLSQHQVQTDHHGRIRVQKERLQTANPKIFAGGDIVRGASLVVHAIADGIAAAREIREFIEKT